MGGMGGVGRLVGRLVGAEVKVHLFGGREWKEKLGSYFI